MERQNPRLNHFVIEIANINKQFLKDYLSIKPIIERFIAESKLSIYKKTFYDFKPIGTTAIYILSTSHLSVHTWPESNYLHMDLLTCSACLRETELEKIIKNIFGSNKIKITRIIYE